MGAVRALYARSRYLIREAARFGVVGLVGLVVTDGGANLLQYQAGIGRISSTAIATVAATLITFAGSRYWTFRHRERTGAGRETALFFAVNGIGVAITEACIGLTYPLGLDGRLAYNIALLCGVALATVFRYWLYKKWVWPAGTVTSGAAVPQAPAHRASARFLSAMSTVRLGCGRFWLLAGQPAKFGAVAASGFLITAAGTYLLYARAGVGPLISIVTATLVAVAVSYVANRYWTFRYSQRTSVGRECLLYFILTGAGLVIQLSWLAFTAHVLGLHGRLPGTIVPVIGIGLSALFRYWSCKKLVWRNVPGAPQPVPVPGN